MENVQKRFDKLKLFNIILMVLLMMGSMFPTVKIAINAVVASDSSLAGGFMNVAYFDYADGIFILASMMPFLVGVLCIIGFILCGLEKKVGQCVIAILITIMTVLAAVLTKTSIMPMLKGVVSDAGELGGAILDFAASSEMINVSFIPVFYIQVIMCLVLVVLAFMWKPEDMYIHEFRETPPQPQPFINPEPQPFIDPAPTPKPEPVPTPKPEPEPVPDQTEPADVSLVTYGRIQGISGEYTNKAFRVMPNSPVVIGRDKAQATLIMSDNKISRKHVTIAYNPSTHNYTVTDHSSYGVFNVDTGVRLMKEQPTNLPVGTKLQLSDSAQMFILLEEKTSFNK